MSLRRITSRDNPGYRQALDAASSATARRRLGIAFVEGIHLCQAYRQSRGRPLSAIVAESAHRHAEVAPLAEGAFDALLVPDALFNRISQLGPSVGVAYLVPMVPLPMPSRIDRDAVYLDGLQDPGNVGTILRTCAAVGIRSVLAAPGTVDCWAPKVLRAGMGAHFSLDIHEDARWDEVPRDPAFPVRIASGDAPCSVFAADLRAPGLWVFGNEGAGISAGVGGPGAQRLSIPQQPGVESLNVGAAVAVCLFEQWRQRGFATG
jgi:TrmH family RNA methyltransferase